MSEPLSLAENQILTHLLTDGGAVEESALDPDVLRALEARGLVRCLAGFAIISNTGRALVKATPSPETQWTGGAGPARSAAGRQAPEDADAPEPAQPQADEAPEARADERADAADDGAPRLNVLQEDLLRRAVQGGEPLALDDLDGRVVRALEGRGLARREAGVLEVTDAGRDFYERHVRRRRRARSGWLRVGGAAPAPPPADAAQERHHRAEELRRAVTALEQALSDGTEVEIGDLSATAADALAGLRELADRLERGEDPRRITRRRPS